MVSPDGLSSVKIMFHVPSLFLDLASLFTVNTSTGRTVIAYKSATLLAADQAWEDLFLID